MTINTKNIGIMGTGAGVGVGVGVGVTAGSAVGVTRGVGVGVGATGVGVGLGIGVGVGVLLPLRGAVSGGNVRAVPLTHVAFTFSTSSTVRVPISYSVSGMSPVAL